MKRDELLDFGFCFESPIDPEPVVVVEAVRNCHVLVPHDKPYLTGHDGAMEFCEIGRRLGITPQAAQAAFHSGMKKLANRPETMRKLYGLARWTQDMRSRRNCARGFNDAEF